VDGDRLAQIYGAGVRYFEVHNEPNVNSEGLGANWQNGAAFAEFFGVVCASLRARYKDIRLGFPGLSPGPAGPDGRYPEDKFLQEAAAAVQNADFFGLHAYWGADGSDYQVAVSRVRTLCQRYPNKIVLVTEFSNNDPNLDKAAKGNQYRQFYQAVQTLPANLGAVFAFCLASTSSFASETWVETNGATSAIVGKVAQA
jgi:hypothetical protein